MSTKKPNKPLITGSSKPNKAARIALFIAAYVGNGGNGTKAALAAGYSEKNARTQASVMLKNPGIAKQLQEFRDGIVAKATHECGLTVEKTMREIARLTYSDIGRIIGKDGKILLPHELDDDTRAAVSSFKIDEYGRIEYKFWDKNSASDKAAKILDMYSAEKVEHSGEVTQITRRLIDA